jgi:hypothetical protein
MVWARSTAVLLGSVSRAVGKCGGTNGGGTHGGGTHGGGTQNGGTHGEGTHGG